MVRQSQQRSANGYWGYKKIQRITILFLSMGLILTSTLLSKDNDREKKEQDRKGLLSLTGGRAKREVLQKEMHDVKSRLLIEKDIALGKFAADNRVIKDKIETPPTPKDEFETTAQFEARLRKHREQIEPFKKKYETDYNTLMRKYQEELENIDKKYNHEMAAILNSPYCAEGLNPVLAGYNADKRIYQVRLVEPDGRFWEYELPIEPGAARELSRRKNNLKVEGFYANIDALFLSDVTLIDPVLGKLDLVTKILRSGCKVLDFNELIKMLHRENFFDVIDNKSGEFPNMFELKELRGDPVVLDRALGLMWHRSGSAQDLPFEESAQWVKDLNHRKYAGYQDWRLPTSEEAASLLEKERQNDLGLYIDPIFVAQQANIWTCDATGTGRVWVVSFSLGTVADYRELVEGIYIRPVRSGRVNGGLASPKEHNAEARFDF